MDTATELKLETSRVINASPEVLYDAWLDPSMLAKFMRPGPDMSVPEVKADARVGGRFLIVMRVGDQDLPHEGTYKVLDRPNQLAFTWESPMSPIEDSTVTVDFAPVDGGTKVTVEIEVFDDITIDTEVDSDGGASVGVEWKKDF